MSPSAPSRNLYKAGFFILLVINLAWVLWVVAWDRKPPSRLRGPRSEARVERMMGRRLGLSEDQQREFRALYARHHKEMETMQQQLASQKNALIDLMQPEDSTAADSLIHQIGITETTLQAMTYQHLMQVRELLSPEQQEKFGRLLRRGVERGHGRPHPPQHDKEHKH